MQLKKQKAKLNDQEDQSGTDINIPDIEQIIKQPKTHKQKTKKSICCCLDWNCRIGPFLDI